MKLKQENDGFSPVALILETREEAGVFWDMLRRIKITTDKDAEYNMAVTISDWLSNEAHL